MRRLTRAMGWILLGLWLGVTGQAHELTVAWTVRQGELEIHGTTDGAPAAGAAVELRASNGGLLASGSLDATGRFRSPVPAANRLTVMVDAGFGHRRTLSLSEQDLRGAGPDARAAAAPPADHDHPHPYHPPVDARGSSEAAVGPLVRIGLGVTFLLALAAASMSYGNLRRLANLERRLPPDASRG